MSKNVKILVAIIAIILAVISILAFTEDKKELKTIKSEKQLMKIYEGDNSTQKQLFTNIITMPFSFFANGLYPRYYSRGVYYNDGIYDAFTTTPQSVNSAESSSMTKGNTSKDYSTTNIQVENVDEADITKTDGDYIYSISDTNIIITNVKNPQEIKIEATIKSTDGSMPEDMILYKNQLVVISSKFNSTSYYSYYNNSNTVVKIYNIDIKSNPVLEKEYELCEPYYTSRCINNTLYVIASGSLKKEDDKIVRSYVEDSVEKDIALENIKYLKDVDSRQQTIISIVDLDRPRENIYVSSYLIDISNAYVSENSIYLLNQKYGYDNDIPSIGKMFGIKGIIGLFTDYDNYNYSSGYRTEIYKFKISEDGKVDYDAKNDIEGRTINQYSLDEKNGHLRMALYDSDGARVAIFDEKLNKLGISNYVAKGETMYSSRFIGNKAYLVTYKTMDPLFVIDLSNETNPKVLGELKIPGYSTYLHPYDENHLIGIGMETEEIFNRNVSGKVIPTTARITGMKMALFDVSNVNHPVQISQTVIGDRRTTSAILTNPKALLFSKERNLIAIPVNNYSEDFEVTSSTDNYSSLVNSYTNYNKSYVAEGYFVYNINVKDGFTLKGVITHENTKKDNRYSYGYNNSKLLRGLYIDDNLYTVSETAVKVNKLDTLELVDELKIGL